MSFDFIDATPIKRAGGGGRTAEPNPFTDAVAGIALKKDEKGKPLAKAYVQKHTKDDVKKIVAKIRRQLSDAGRKNNPACTVNVSVVPKQTGPKGKETASETESVVTFWTGPLVIRARKPKTAA